MLTTLRKPLARLAAPLAARSYSGATASVEIHEQKVKVGKIDINYVSSSVKGANPTKTVVCLPGALGELLSELLCHSFWQDQLSGSAFTDFKPQIENLPKLLPNFKVIAWDPPGYGKSIPPAKTFTTDFLEKDADLLNELMAVIEVPKYNVLGWSDGGITGMIIAGKYSSNVEKLVIFGSNAYILDEELKIYDGIRDVSKWSARMREPLEKLYGAEYFKTKWAEWVDTFKAIHK